VNERPLPRDDRELELVTGIRPADHEFTAASPETITQMERRMLGADWFRKRKPEEEK
jgi:hypothetical protein